MIQNEKFISSHSHTEHVPTALRMRKPFKCMIVSNREFNCFQKVVCIYHLLDAIFIRKTE